MRTNKKAARHKVRGKKKAARKTKVFSLGMSLGSRDQEASEPTLPETPEPTTQPSEVDTDVEAFKNLATRSQPGVLLVDFPPPTAKEIDQQNRRVIAEYHKQLAAGELFDGKTKRKAGAARPTT